MGICQRSRFETELRGGPSLSGARPPVPRTPQETTLLRRFKPTTAPCTGVPCELSWEERKQDGNRWLRETGRQVGEPAAP